MRRSHILLTILIQFCFTNIHAQTKYAKTLLWQISGNDLIKPSYLYGTFHITHKEVFDVNDSVLSKLILADAFANEVNMDSISQFIEKLSMNDLKELRVSEILNQDEQKRLDNFLRKKAKTSLKEMGDPTANEVYLKISKFKHEKGDMKTFLDGWLYNIARNHNKKIFGVENMQDTYEMLRKYPRDEQREMILSIIDSSDVLSATESRMLSDYLDQDLNAINDLMITKSSEFMNEVLIKDRNKIMLKNMMRIMGDQSCFFAVGTAHLPGEKGLIALLEKEGYTVTPIVAPKTGYYKKFISEDTGPAWEKFTENEYGYSIDMPGKPGIVNYGDYRMHAYYNVGTGKFYFSYAQPLTDQFREMDKDDFIRRLEKNLSKQGKTSNRHEIVYKGHKGVETDIENDKLIMRMRILYDEETAFIFMEGEQNNHQNKVEYSNAFFNSVEFFQPAEIKYIEYVSDSGAFKIIAPENFAITKSKNSDRYNLRNLVGKDPNLKFTLTIAYTDYGFGRYFDNTDKVFTTIIKNFEDKINGESDLKETTFQGYPAREQKLKTRNEYSRIIYVIRENRLYTIVAETFDFGRTSFVDSIIESFSFTPYPKIKLSAFESPEGDFTILFPVLKHFGQIKAEDEEDSEDSDSLTQYYYSRDPSSSSSFIVIGEQYSKYYYSTKDDSTYLAGVLKSLYPADSIIKSEILRTNSSVSIRGKILFTKNPLLSAYTKLLLTGNKIYTVVTYLPTDSHGDSLAYLFLNSFRIKKDEARPTIFSSKLKDLLHDLQSSDTTVVYPLFTKLDNYDISEGDTSLLIGALKRSYLDDSLFGRNTRYHLYKSILESFTDSSMAADYVIRNYSGMGANGDIKLLALKYLAKVPSENNYSLLKKLLLKDRPYPRGYDLPDPDYNTVVRPVNNLFAQLYADSNYYSRSLYPELLTLSKDDYYCVDIFRTTANLLDDSILNDNDILFVKDELIKKAIDEYQTLIKDTIDNESNYSSNLENLLRIISRFADSNVIDLNKKVINSKLYDHYSNPITFLARKNIRPDERLVEHYLELPYYRYDAYAAYSKADKLEWFPKKFNDQKYFAENDLYSYLDNDDDVPESMKFIEKLPVKYNDAEEVIYIFKIFYSEDNKPVTYVAWAGPYSSDISKPDLNSGELTGSNFDIWDDKGYREIVLKAIKNGEE